MSAYDFNPHVCLQVFYGIAEEIPSGVRGNDLKVINPKIEFTQELVNYIKNAITVSTTRALDCVWTNYDIPGKLKELGKIEEKSPKSDAWRPTTGKVNLNPIIADNLLKRKMELTKQIELVREESAMIIPYVKAFSEQTKEQLKEIDEIEEKYEQII